MSNLDLYTQMRGLCEQAKQEAGLFTAYQQDLTVHDRSYIADDAQAGDVLLWVIKTCGTWLALIEGTREYARAILNTVATGERIYLIEVDRHTGKLAFGRIRPQTLSQAKEAVETLRTKEDRTPRRVYLADQLKALGLDQTIVATDLSRISREPGQSAYLKFEGSLLQVLVPSAGIDRVLHRPQVTEATAYRLEVTSAFGHAELHEITPAAFKRHLMRMSGNPPKHRAA
jgi:hypothetical protein